jgi:hypothetical protein
MKNMIGIRGFVKQRESTLQFKGGVLTNKITGKYSVLRGTDDDGRTILYGLTEKEADMAVRFLTKVEAEGGNLWRRIQNRLYWADSRNRGLNKLIRPSLVHGGITMPPDYDPLNLAIEGDEIVVDRNYGAVSTQTSK